MVAPGGDINQKADPPWLNDSVIPEIQDAVGGAQNLAVGWVDYDPSTFRNAFGAPEVTSALAEAEAGRPLPTGEDALPENLRTTQAQGVREAVRQIAAQARECPNQRFIVAGYSEGAWVLGDALQYAAIAGAEPTLQPYYSRIDEVLLFGDPMFDSDSPAARRPADLDQPGPRRALGVAARALGPREQYLPAELEDRAQSYCHGGPDTVDPVCATPGGRPGQREPEPNLTVSNEEWVEAMDRCGAGPAGLLSPAALANVFPQLYTTCGHLKYTGGYARQYSGHLPFGSPTRVTLTISSTTPGWRDTGLSVEAGETVSIQQVSGSWTVDEANFGRVGPQGYSPTDDHRIAPGCKIVDSTPYGALLGAVGTTPADVNTPSPVTWLGAGGQFRAQVAGKLFLRINDLDRCLGDNAGVITVTVQK